MPEPSRRQFMGASATLAALPRPGEPAPVRDGTGQAESTDPYPPDPAEPMAALPSVTLHEGPVYVDGWPDENSEIDPEACELFATTTMGRVHVSATSSSDDAYISAGFELEPEGAEFLAGLLEDFARRARRDEHGAYNVVDRADV